jgi:hypothetical protein
LLPASFASALTTALASACTLTTTLAPALTHAGVSGNGGLVHPKELSSPELFCCISHAASTLVLIDIDLGSSQGLHGIGAQVSGNKSRDALLCDLRGGLNSSAAGCIDI